MNKSFIRVLLVLAAFLFISQAPIASAAFNRDLYFGLTNDSDVMNLQQVLKVEGCFNGVPSGNFDDVTRQAVLCFQAKYNFTSIPSSGYVGAYTRSVLNQRSASASQSATAVTTSSSTSTTVTTTQQTYPGGCTSDAGFSATTGKSCSVIYPAGCAVATAFSAINGAPCVAISMKTYSDGNFTFKYPENMFVLVPVHYTYSPDYKEYTGVKLVPTDPNGIFYPACDYTTLNSDPNCNSGNDSGIEFAIIDHSTAEEVSRLNPANKINTTLVGRPAVKYYFDANTEGVAYYHIQLDANTALMIKRIYKQTSAGRFPSDESFEQVLATFVLNPKYPTASLSTAAYPEGCVSFSGFSAITGASCSITPPSGCTATTTYSATTGKSCSVNYAQGCSSNVGFSAVTGQSCSPSTVTHTIEITLAPTVSGCDSTSGFSATTGQACDGSTKITVVSPNEGTWYFGNDYEISWDSSGLNGDVKIQLIGDASHPVICNLGTVAASQGRFNFNLKQQGCEGGDLISAYYLVQVMANNFVFDRSDNFILVREKTSTSSICSSSSVVKLYEQVDFGGKCVGFNSDQASLLGYDLNDIVSSVVVANGYTATLYEHVNYAGRSKTFTAGGTSYVGDDFDNMTSSLKIAAASQ